MQMNQYVSYQTSVSFGSLKLDGLVMIIVFRIPLIIDTPVQEF